ncbi:UDP glucuronosyltransferase 2 family, polypeptide A5 isoform X10 [Astyanax mexicanus]|uniref:UDP glucuronosyltransferase 2 family, polypeptide A5 isoform X10 n=1 Tax=Astyanax mexicanus TaxID=7994 RepID=UPI0020CADA7D|nr:UDP glucuronosyltransferase 2 family, polypeptide A5 isoform X10 [Astyanax mexicanus]
MVPNCVLPLVALLLLCGSEIALGGNILLLPGEFSHWINMRAIVDELVARNHSVAVLTHSATPSVKHWQKENFRYVVFKIDMDEQAVQAMWQNFISTWLNETVTGFQAMSLTWKMMSDYGDYLETVCNGMLLNQELIASLKESNFDLVLYDPVMPCSDLLADTLGLPHIVSFRISFAYTVERLCGQLPAPPSYVPAGGAQGHLSDQMNFMERVENMLLYIGHTSVLTLQVMFTFGQYYTKITGKPTTLCDTLGKADIWLIRTYWDFEYPRPLLPNFKFVGGLHCKPAKPLPKEMEEFVQSSGDDGIVVFSLGSMINNLTKERANAIASGLGQIPQKVLWRYSGQKPDTLAPNTKLYDWIPQNDLLGHPKTKAFVTHGGTNGLYEAIYHGVPMVGIPLFGDQPDNLFHMKTKGAAEIVEFLKMTSGDLKEALTAVITNPSYKESMMRLSRIHHDRPVKALDEAVYWIEFVMRNKGAKHLRVEAHNLTWYQYHCLDVIAFLLVIVALVIFIFVKTCKWLFRKCCRRSSAKSKKE